MPSSTSSSSSGSSYSSSSSLSSRSDSQSIRNSPQNLKSHRPAIIEKSSSAENVKGAVNELYMTDMEAFKETVIGKEVANHSLHYIKSDQEKISVDLTRFTPNNSAVSSAVDFFNGPERSVLMMFRELLNFKLWRAKHYRSLDYCAASVELFLEELTLEYCEQEKRAKSKGDSIKRFTWKNSGALSINFALTCDCAKRLYNSLALHSGNKILPLAPATSQKGTNKTFEAFMVGFLCYLVHQSGISEKILTLNTYQVKLSDWKKGGTRYTGTHNQSSDHVNNVLFPSDEERRKKLESFIVGSKEIIIESKIVPQEIMVSGADGVLRPLKTASGLVYRKAPKTTVRGSAVQSHGPGSIGNRAPPGILSGVKSIREPIQHNPFKQKLLSLFGGSALYYPPHRLGLMNAFVKVIETAPDKNEKQYVLRFLGGVPAASSQVVFAAFDESGGLRVFRSWILREFTCASIATNTARVSCKDKGDSDQVGSQEEDTKLAHQAKISINQVRNHLSLGHSIIAFVTYRFLTYSSKTADEWLSQPLAKEEVTEIINSKLIESKASVTSFFPFIREVMTTGPLSTLRASTNTSEGQSRDETQLQLSLIDEYLNALERKLQKRIRQDKTDKESVPESNKNPLCLKSKEMPVKLGALLPQSELRTPIDEGRVTSNHDWEGYMDLKETIEEKEHWDEVMKLSSLDSADVIMRRSLLNRVWKSMAAHHGAYDHVGVGHDVGSNRPALFYTMDGATLDSLSYRDQSEASVVARSVIDLLHQHPISHIFEDTAIGAGGLSETEKVALISFLHANDADSIEQHRKSLAQEAEILRHASEKGTKRAREDYKPLSTCWYNPLEIIQGLPK
eukprot:Tbor_TRINITY_DN5458_c0_g1::TRINITY_DN5458_c0_g1_i2::g.24593::m.24593